MKILMIGDQCVGHSLKSIADGCLMRGHVVDHILTRRAFLAGGKDAVKKALANADFKKYDMAMLWNPRWDLEPENIKYIASKIFTVWYTNDAPPAIDNDGERKRRDMVAQCHAAIFCTQDEVNSFKGSGRPAILRYPPYDMLPFRYHPLTAEPIAKVTAAMTTCYTKAEYPAVLADRGDIAHALIKAGIDFKAVGTWDNNKRGWCSTGIDENHYHPYIPNDGMPWHYHHTLININNHTRPDMLQYANRRLVIAMGAGGFVLCDRVKGLDEIFKEGVHLAYWSTIEELLDKTKYYLAHNDERQKIALQGQMEILRRHNSLDFADALVGLKG